MRHARRRADGLLIDTIVAWLTERNQRWPACANPHLLVTYKSAYGLGPASTGYIRGISKPLPTTAAGLRADRLLDEARISGGDPLRPTRLIPIFFAETRPLAEEWTFGFLGAALAYANADQDSGLPS